MAKHTMHYTGDTFDLDADEATSVLDAMEKVANGASVLLRFVDIRPDTARGGTETVRRFLFTAGVPIYLTET